MEECRRLHEILWCWDWNQKSHDRRTDTEGIQVCGTRACVVRTPVSSVCLGSLEAVTRQ